MWKKTCQSLCVENSSLVSLEKKKKRTQPLRTLFLLKLFYLLDVETEKRQSGQRNRVIALETDVLVRHKTY